MKMIVAAVLVVLASTAWGLPQRGAFNQGAFPRPFVPIISQNYDLNPIDNSYNFNYESGDGSSRHESGAIKNPGTQVEAMSVTGSYSYVSPDGTPITVEYIADENGFQPIGTHIHPSIQRAVAAQVAESIAAGPGPIFNNAFQQGRK